MWLGRHPKGCAQTMFSVPVSASAAISAGMSHPSPIFTPWFMTRSAHFLRCSKSCTGSKRLYFFVRRMSFLCFASSQR